jgi:hypothetical protein
VADTFDLAKPVVAISVIVTALLSDSDSASVVKSPAALDRVIAAVTVAMF